MLHTGVAGLLGAGVGMAAEYSEHRKQRKLSRGKSQQNLHPEQAPASSDPDTASVYSASVYSASVYSTDVGSGSEPLLASQRNASGQEYSGRNNGYISMEDDEEDWLLDEALERDEPPPYEEVEQNPIPVDELVQDVSDSNRAALSEAPAFERTPLPFPVIIPQRRPRQRTRGFVRAYAPALGECSGIDQETFLKFLKNFHKSSQANPILPAVRIAASIAGNTPDVIAIAVCTAVEIAAAIGEEVQGRTRTNSFLDKMNEEMFKPAGLYAMIVKYKGDSKLRQRANTVFAKIGVSGEKVDFNTNQSIAKYHHEDPDNQSIRDRMRKIRMASGETRGASQIPECCPLIFPRVDEAISRDGPETFKDKTKDAKKFLVDYMDRRAQMEYARTDPSSALCVPESERTFKAKLADPSHPMYNGGFLGFVSGGYLTPLAPVLDPTVRASRLLKQFRKDETKTLKYEPRMENGGDRLSAGASVGQPEGEDSHGERPGAEAQYDGQTRRHSDHQDNERAPQLPYGRQPSAGLTPAGSGDRNQNSARDAPRASFGRGGILGGVKRVMREDVLYLTIVNMPTERELAEAKEKMAKAKKGTDETC